jgi:putative transposase
VVAYPLSTRPVEALMQERRVSVDDATINWWVVQLSPPRQEVFQPRTRPVWLSWRRDEASIGVRAHWYDRSRAMETSGHAIDVLLTTHRNEPAATRVLTKAIRRHGGPETVMIDGREAHAAALRNDHVAYGTALVIRQVTYVHKIIEQDYPGVQYLTRPM